jgi:Bacterial sugar transferase
VPYYQRRHLIRPGLSGWAQIHCGYARSDSGSVLKHCHDLYYLKNRSFGMDLAILGVTARLVLLGAVRRSEAVARSVVALEQVPSTRQMPPEGAKSASGGDYGSAPT